jgi:hypothetical protein
MRNAMKGNQGNGIPQQITLTRKIVMAYLVFVFPTLLIFLALHLFTTLRGPRLYISMIPVAIVLLIIYIAYLIQPRRFFRFWGEQVQHQNSNSK